MSMPSKSPHSQSATSGSGSGSGSPKANFKHSLPQHVPHNYFLDIRRRLEDGVHTSEIKRRRTTTAHGAAAQRYDGEDHQVSLDLVEACRCLESAPLEMSATAHRSNTLRRKSSMHSSNSKGHLSTPPPSPAPTRPPPSPVMMSSSSSPLPPPQMALSQGRTSDGLYGLNHFPPQKDVFNGPAQAFLETDCESLASAPSWQRWAESRSRFFEQGAAMAAEVFTFACVDETIVAVSPSTPTPTGGQAAHNSSRTSTPSTPFRRSPRPDYEAKLQELQAHYHRIGASSYLHFDKALLVHVWRSGKAASRFTHAWQRCWQALFEHRIVGIHCPLSVMYSIQGVSVSVTALPPVYIDRVPPIQNVFAPYCNAEEISLTRRNAKPLSSVDDKGCTSPILGAMLCRLFAVLHLPQDESIIEEYGDAHLYHGIDGRMYLLHIGPMIPHTTPALQTPGTKYASPVRHELLREMLLEGGDKPQPESGFRAIHRFMLQRAIPKAVDNAVSLLPQGTADSRRPEVLLRDGFLSMMLHDHGINMSYLYHVYEYCAKMGAARTPAQRGGGGKRRGTTEAGGGGTAFVHSPGDGDDDAYIAGAPPQDSLHRAHTTVGIARRFASTVPGGEDDGLNRAIVQGEYYKLLAMTCCMEMVARTVKALAKLDMGGGFTTSVDFKTSTTVRLDMVNRVARLAASRDQDFLVDHVIPMLKAKYSCPEAFQVGWEVLSTGSVLKILSLHLGAEYGVQEGRFKLFAPFAQKKALLMFPIVPIDALLNRDERRMQQGVAQLWEDANRVIGRPHGTEQAHVVRDAAHASLILSPLHAAFVARAVTFSVVTRTHRSHVVAYTSAFDGGSVKKGWPLYLVAEMVSLAAAVEDRRPGERCEQWKAMLVEMSRLAYESAHAASQRTKASSSGGGAADDLRLLSLHLLHHAVQLLRAKRTGAAHCARRAVEQLTSIPYVDFVFDAHVAQAIKSIEEAFAELDVPSLRDYFHGIVEAVVSSLRRWNRMSNAAKYLQRVVTSMVHKTLAEEAPESVRVGQLAFSTLATLYGSHDGRTLMSLYALCLFSLSSLKSAKPSIAHGINNLRKVIQKHHSLSPAMQISFGRTNTVQTLLTKVLEVVVECGGDHATVSSIKVALFHAERYRHAVLTMQSVGRGYMRRQMMRTHTHGIAPFLPPQRPSSMVYFDGQVPLTLGQAANLGISLEDDSTRNGGAGGGCGVVRHIPLDAQSDISSVTGSFMSGSNSAKSRFAGQHTPQRSTTQHPSGGPAPPPHMVFLPPPALHGGSVYGGVVGTTMSLPADPNSSTAAEQSFSFGSPNRGPVEEDSPLASAGRGFSIGSFAESLPNATTTARTATAATRDYVANQQQHVLRPVPRDSGPSLPSAPIPDHMVRTVMRLQPSSAAAHESDPRAYTPDWQVPQDGLHSPPGAVPDAPPPQRQRVQSISEHRGKMVPSAWNFDVPYDPRTVDSTNNGQVEGVANGQGRTSGPGSLGSPSSPQRSSLGRSSELSKSQEPKSSGAVLTNDLTHTMLELFALCDTDNDGYASVRECVEGVGKLHWMPVDDLRQLFSAVAIKQQRGGITGFFSKPKEVLTSAEFHTALVKAGVLSVALR